MMSHYVTQIAIYGIGIFAAGVAWEVVAALIHRYRNPTLRFSRTTDNATHNVPRSA